MEGAFTLEEDSGLIESISKLSEAGVRIHFFYLDAPLKTCLQRNINRKTEKDIKDRWVEKWYKSSSPGEVAQEHVIDTSQAGPKELVDKILEIIEV